MAADVCREGLWRLCVQGGPVAAVCAGRACGSCVCRVGLWQLCVQGIEGWSAHSLARGVLGAGLGFVPPCSSGLSKDHARDSLPLVRVLVLGHTGLSHLACL